MFLDCPLLFPLLKFFGCNNLLFLVRLFMTFVPSFFFSSLDFLFRYFLLSSLSLLLCLSWFFPCNIFFLSFAFVYDRSFSFIASFIFLLLILLFIFFLFSSLSLVTLYFSAFPSLAFISRFPRLHFFYLIVPFNG